jgi:hypothetical protein
MRATIEFTGQVETEADSEDGIAATAEELLDDLNTALSTWRAIYEAMGWTVTLSGRVLHEDGRPWMQLAL